MATALLCGILGFWGFSLNLVALLAIATRTTVLGTQFVSVLACRADFLILDPGRLETQYISPWQRT